MENFDTLHSQTDVNPLNRKSIRFVLVEPSHPGNIGATARAIKTMGFSELVLVSPQTFPHPDAFARASGATDILDNCHIVDSLDDAISECELIIGTSVRERQITWPTSTPRETAERITHFLKEGSQNIAILFGRERTGLENHELDSAQWQIRIPANKQYNSLNLASAVQIIAYEINCQFDEEVMELSNKEVDKVAKSNLAKRQRLATHTEMQAYYHHLEETLHQLDFIKTNPPTKLLRKINRLYNRANVSFEELQILRGILTATQKAIQNKLNN